MIKIPLEKLKLYVLLISSIVVAMFVFLGPFGFFNNAIIGFFVQVGIIVCFEIQKRIDRK